MDRDEVWQHTHGQRRALAAILADLDESEWRVPSLCAAWSVRDVAAHVIRSPSATFGELARGAVDARGRWTTMVRDDAIRSAGRPVEEIVADYRRYDRSRRRPLGTAVSDPLLDVLVHTQDVVVPLHRTHTMPVEAAAVAARRAHRIRYVFEGWRDLHGLELRATDAPLVLGDGLPVEGPTEAILLLVTGRRVAAIPRLSGSGLSQVS